MAFAVFLLFFLYFWRSSNVILCGQILALLGMLLSVIFIGIWSFVTNNRLNLGINLVCLSYKNLQFCLSPPDIDFTNLDSNSSPSLKSPHSVTKTIRAFLHPANC